MKDVVVIGSGAGGGPLAARLAEAGLKVLVLEKGRNHSHQEYLHDEISIVRRDFFVPSVPDAPHTIQRPGRPKELTDLGWIARCVGGGTVHMGGFFYRLHPEDFRMRSRYGPFENLADWPFSYEELEPYYVLAEWEVGVSGRAGSNPFEGPRSRPYPMPPVQVSRLATLIDQAARRLNVTSFPSPRAIASRPYRGRSECVYCDFCASYGCEVGAKSSTQETVLARAVATGHCELVPEAMVTELTSEKGRVTGCVYIDADGRRREVAAKVVCVSCSAVESARLLLLSKIGNRNGQVGRNLQFQANTSGSARYELENHRNKPFADAHPFLGRSVADHTFIPEGVADIAKGGIIRFGFPHRNPIYTALRLSREGEPVLWGDALKEKIREYYHDVREIEFEIFHDFIPNDRTYVDLDPEVKDRWGLPVARIHLDPPKQHALVGAWLMKKGLDILKATGADELRQGVAGATNSSLVHGTCRAGLDPDRSVLNEYCQSHEVPNLFVVDGSFLPTSGGAPTTLTILANSFRVAGHIAARFKAGEFR